MTTEKCKITGNHWLRSDMTKEQVAIMSSISNKIFVDSFTGFNVLIADYQRDDFIKSLPIRTYGTHFNCENRYLFIANRSV